MPKIGIMGGTFNPVHMGHLALAQWALEEEGLDQVWFIPTGCSYMKREQDIVPKWDRYQMTSLAVAGNDRLRCLDVEVRREGRTYSYETLELLREEYPEDNFYFIFGADCLFAIETWRNPQRIFDGCSVIAAVRGETSREEMERKIEELKDRYGADIILMPFMNLELSSTHVRELVKGGRSVRYLVPEAVAAYIEEKGFYRDEDE